MCSFTQCEGQTELKEVLVPSSFQCFPLTVAPHSELFSRTKCSTPRVRPERTTHYGSINIRSMSVVLGSSANSFILMVIIAPDLIHVLMFPDSWKLFGFYIKSHEYQWKSFGLMTPSSSTNQGRRVVFQFSYRT